MQRRSGKLCPGDSLETQGTQLLAKHAHHSKTMQCCSPHMLHVDRCGEWSWQQICCISRNWRGASCTWQMARRLCQWAWKLPWTLTTPSSSPTEITAPSSAVAEQCVVHPTHMPQSIILCCVLLSCETLRKWLYGIVFAMRAVSIRI